MRNAINTKHTGLAIESKHSTRLEQLREEGRQLCAEVVAAHPDTYESGDWIFDQA